MNNDSGVNVRDNFGHFCFGQTLDVGTGTAPIAMAPDRLWGSPLCFPSASKRDHPVQPPRQQPLCNAQNMGFQLRITDPTRARIGQDG